MTDVHQKRNVVWIMLVAAGLFEIACYFAIYFHTGRADLKLCFYGLATLLMAPQAFLRYPTGLSITLILSLLGATLAIVVPFVH